MRRFFIGLVVSIVVLSLLVSHKLAGLALITLMFMLAFREVLCMTRPTIPSGFRGLLSIFAYCAFLFFAVFIYTQSIIFSGMPLQSYETNATTGHAILVPSSLIGLSANAFGTALSIVLLIWIFVFALIAFKVVTDFPSGSFSKETGLFVLALFSVVFFGLTSFSLVYLCTQLEVWFIVILLSWGADAGALFIGRSIGKKKLCPNVSPRKTVEGFIGALLSGSMAVLIYILILGRVEIGYGFCLTFKEVLLYTLVSALIIALAHLGDLFMSVVKRTHKLKESGTLIPEHGGAIDKLDSFFVVSVILLFIVAVTRQSVV